MTRGRILVGVATLAAVLGGLAFVTGAGAIAALAGLCAIAAASMAARSRVPGAELVTRRPLHRTAPPPPPSAVADAHPAPDPAPSHPFTDDGVLAEDFLDVTLENRVAVARRALRPLSIVYLEVLDVNGSGEAERVTGALVAATISETLRESDVVGRRADGVYVFVLEDTGEDGAVWTAERMRRSLSSATGHRRFHAGVASYPTHGLDADAIGAKAQAALEAAREWKRDRIEVATGA